jgi:hypothetical protein
VCTKKCGAASDVEKLQRMKLQILHARYSLPPQKVFSPPSQRALPKRMKAKIDALEYFFNIPIECGSKHHNLATFGFVARFVCSRRGNLRRSGVGEGSHPSKANGEGL